MPNPITQYSSFDEAYDYFNAQLFEGKLPLCMITLQRKRQSYGYFWPQQFGSRLEDNERVDEIALNPATFEGRSDADILSTLVHEMVHLWQFHFGTWPKKPGYHNKEWATQMRIIGLTPYNTKNPNLDTGTTLSHTIVEGGLYQRAYGKLSQLSPEFRLEWQAQTETPAQKKTRKAKKASKTKYTCGDCGLNAWAKPEVKIACYECDNKLMVPNP